MTLHEIGHGGVVFGTYLEGQMEAVGEGLQQPQAGGHDRLLLQAASSEEEIRETTVVQLLNIFTFYIKVPIN